MAGHDAQKLLGSFGGPGVQGTTEFMEMLGLRPGRPWTVMAGLSEFDGGLLTLLGFFSPVGPVGVMGSMAMAWTKAHRGKPIWVTEGDVELPVTNMAAATALILNGPGRHSLDRTFGLRLPGWLAPLGLVVLPVLYAGVDTPETPEQDEACERTVGDGDA